MAYLKVLWTDRPRDETRPLLYLARDGVLRKLWHGTVRLLPYRSLVRRAQIVEDETDNES